MPELPEVEITCRGIGPWLTGAEVSAVLIRQPRLRYPVPSELLECLPGQRVLAVRRRAKYILIDFADGVLMLHLGMSGSLRIVPSGLQAEKHDHFDLVLGDRAMRLRDPRRFGSVLWLPTASDEHPLLAALGQEPLDPVFDGALLAGLLSGRSTPVKLAIMDSHLLVGVGNIYASESLFRARIHPLTPARRLGAVRCARLAGEIRQTLEDALAAGGSTLRDFVHSDGSPGYFQQQYFVYGRDGEACRVCQARIVRTVMAQRATFHCPRCQRLPSGR
jgi:formamidopyrimidine-DNA glycosylase